MRALFILLFLPFLGKSQTIEVGVNAGSIFMGSASILFLKHIKAGAGYEAAKIPGNYRNLQTNTPFLFCEYSKSIKRHEVYGGGNFGIGSFKNDFYYPIAYKGRGSSVKYGAQIGYSYNIIAGLCVNAEIGYESVSIKLNPIQENKGWNTWSASTSYFPVSIGVHYKICK